MRRRGPRHQPFRTTRIGTVKKSRLLVRAILALCAVAVMATIALWPVETRHGLNYEWSSTTIPLYEKAVNFVSRDLQVRRILDDVIGDETDPHRRVVRLFDWVHANVRPTPQGFPVVDDHILNILIRGYGAQDQRTEAFALLSTYAGMPATYLMEKGPDGVTDFHFALVEVEGDLFLFDVVNGIAFQDSTGELVDVERLRSDPELLGSGGPIATTAGSAYRRVLTSDAARDPSFERMEMQIPWRRLRIEVGRALGFGAGG